MNNALALASGTNHSKLPADADEWLMTRPAGDHLVVLDSLRGKAQYRNAYGWRETLKTMEQNWFAPLHTALKEGKINQLSITALNEASPRDFSLTRSDLWKFWRITKPLSIHSKKH